MFYDAYYARHIHSKKFGRCQNCHTGRKIKLKNCGLASITVTFGNVSCSKCHDESEARELSVVRLDFSVVVQR